MRPGAPLKLQCSSDSILCHAAPSHAWVWITPEGATAERTTDTDKAICSLPTVKGTSYSSYSEVLSPAEGLQGSSRPGIEQLRRANASRHGAVPLQAVGVL